MFQESTLPIMTTPSAPASDASRLFITGAASPPVPGGEHPCPVNSFTPSIDRPTEVQPGICKFKCYNLAANGDTDVLRLRTSGSRRRGAAGHCVQGARSQVQTLRRGEAFSFP